MALTDEIANDPTPGVIAGNIGEPIMLTGVNLHGVAAKACRGGEQAEVYVRLSMTSDDANFHRIVEGLSEAIQHYALRAGKGIDFDRACMIVLVIKSNDQAELWVDAAAVTLNIMVKRSMKAGTVLFENDIGDVSGMWFPTLTFDKTDRIVVLFRQDWAFGLYFDFNPEGDLDCVGAQRHLGRLYRLLKYRHLYQTMANETMARKLIAAGWFPFVEILPKGFRELTNTLEADFPLDDIETKLLASFDDNRLDQMLTRWASKPHFQDKQALLEAAIKHFKANESIAAIKIAITEIEGILRAAYPSTRKPRPKLGDLLDFAIESAAQKAGGIDTLLLPEAFAQYLRSYTFARFDPANSLGNAGSRHAVGHGAAEADSYTQVRALQVLLTLDQLAFYT